MKHIFRTINFTLGFLFIITGFVIVGYFVVKEEKPVVTERTIESSEIKSLIPADSTLFENQVSLSPDGRYYTFLTTKDLSLKDSKVWLLKSTGKELQPIAFGDEFRNISSPTWDPTSNKIAFIKVFPFELYVYDINTKKTELVYSEKEHEEDNVLSPSLAYGNKAYLLWLNNNEIEFENTKPIKKEYYSVNIETKEVKKTERQDDYQNPSLNSDISSYFFSQRDPSWNQVQLGGCEEETFESAGCTVSAVSMLLSYFYEDTNPVDLNNFLSQNKNQGYFEGCQIRWNVVPNFSENIRLKGVYFNEFNLERVDYELAHGNPVLIGYDYVWFTGIPHWIIIVKKENDQYLALDPWDKTPRLIPYTNYGKEFNHMVVYEKISSFI